MGQAKVKAVVKKRFNHMNPGTDKEPRIIECTPAEFETWAAYGYVEAVKEKPKAKAKAAPKKKVKTGPEVKK
jgi:hypothetical protein